MEMVHFVPPSQRLKALEASRLETPVLICGGSGSGKGALAKWIHQSSARAGKTLIEADKSKSLSSQILEAQGGSLIVPDIGEWPFSEQRVLLDYLATRSIPHLSNNGTRMIVNTRILVTTHQNLESRAIGGLFNPELHEALNQFRIDMPGLAKRMGEFDDIAHGLMREIARELHKEHLKGFSPAAMEVLRAYSWPGNVRELRNVLRLAVIAAVGDIIEAVDIPDLGNPEKLRINLKATRDEFERVYLLELLKTYGWNLERTAHAARISNERLIEKINRYELFKEKFEA